MLQRQPLRFLLADDPGAGKAIMAGLLIKELMARGDVKRCLICVPGNFVDQWQDELWFKFQLRFQQSTREMAESAGTDYVRHEFNRAEQLLDGGRKGTVGFALTVLQRRLASAPEAIYKSLVRRRERLEKRLQEVRAIGHLPEVEAARRLAQIMDGDVVVSEDYLDDLEDAPAAEAEQVEELVMDSATAAMTDAELEAEIETLRGLERKAFRVRQSWHDEKWNQLATLLQEDEQMVAERSAGVSPAEGASGDARGPQDTVRQKLDLSSAI